MAPDHDDFLYQYQESPDPDFTTRLRDQLLAGDRADLTLPSTTLAAGAAYPATGMRGRRWSGRMRALMGGVALLCVVTLTPLRVVATNILHQLGLVQITNAPTYADMIAAGQTPTPQPPSVPEVIFTYDGDLTDLATIQAQAGFTVYHVGSLPPGSHVFDRDVQHVVDADYATATVYRLRGQSSMLTLFQVREGTLFNQMAVGNAATESVTINGHPGVWIQGFTFVAQDEGMIENRLIWNADGFTFLLSGAPSKEESLQLAASVAPAPCSIHAPRVRCTKRQYQRVASLSAI